MVPDLIGQVIYDKKKIVYAGTKTRCDQWRSAQHSMVKRHLKFVANK